jgi:uncharacterized membrane protein YgcG
VPVIRSVLCAALIALAGLPAWAAVSRDDAAMVAQRETGGRVLSVESAQVDGRPVWRVKVVTPRGDVRVVLVEMGSSGDAGGGNSGYGGGNGSYGGGHRR